MILIAKIRDAPHIEHLFEFKLTNPQQTPCKREIENHISFQGGLNYGPDFRREIGE